MSGRNLEAIVSDALGWAADERDLEMERRTSKNTNPVSPERGEKVNTYTFMGEERTSINYSGDHRSATLTVAFGSSDVGFPEDYSSELGCEVLDSAREKLEQYGELDIEDIGQNGLSGYKVSKN